MKKILSLTIIGLLLFSLDLFLDKQSIVVELKAAATLLSNEIWTPTGGADVTSTSEAIDTTGATLIAVLLTGNGATATLTDSASNVYTLLTDSGNASHCRIGYKINPTTSATHTFTTTGLAGYRPGAIALAFSGTGAINATDTRATDNTSGTTLAPGSITPTGNELFITVTGHGNSVDDESITASIGSSFTELSGGATEVQDSTLSTGTAGAYKVSSSAENPTWTMSSAQIGRCAAMAAFTETVVAKPPRLIGGGFF